MIGEITQFTFELYRKTTRKNVLAKGPDDKKFWIKFKTCALCVNNYNEGKLLKELRGCLYYWLGESNPAKVKMCKYHFGESSLRVSLWALVEHAGACYKCHVEGACSYC